MKEQYPEELTTRQAENFDTIEQFSESDSYKEDYERAVKYAKKINGVVYTMVDGEGNKIYYLKGFHFVNRFGYAVFKRSVKK